MLIVYCENCSRRISDNELSTGKARRVDENRALCPECAPAHVPLPAAGPARVRTPAPAPSPVRAKETSGGTTAVRIARTSKVAAARKGDHAESVRGAEPLRKGSNTAVILCSVAGVVILGGVIFLLSGNSNPPAGTEQTKKTDVASVPAAPVKISKIDTPLPAPGPGASVNPVAPPPKAAVNEDHAAQQKAARNADNEMADLRDELAASRLKDAKAFAQANPQDPWGYKDKLEGVVSSYKSTPAGQEAVKLLAGLKVPEKPKPAEQPKGAEPKGAGDWKVILDPKVIAGLNSQCLDAWQSTGQAFENIPGKDNAAQTAGDYGDGEYHIRFEASVGSSFTFSFRQGAGGVNSIFFNGAAATKVQGKPIDLYFVCHGDQTKLTIDGQAYPVTTERSPNTGRIQFNVHYGSLKIYTIEWRKVEN